MANILNSLSKIQNADVVMSVRDIKKTFIEGGQPLHILRGGGFDLRRGLGSQLCCNVSGCLISQVGAVS